jgi:2'-5' RNA ligase
MRLFVAADLPQDARDALAGTLKRLASTLGGSGGKLRWVSAERAHLTLVFLGDVDEPRVPAVVDAMSRDVSGQPFDITLDTIGVFPPRGAPRVLWIGVGAGASEVTDLQREMTRRIGALGIPLEDRPFHPHLTLARWRESRSTDRDRALRSAPHGVVARARIEGATLYQSHLSSSGPSYTALARATLTRSAGR